MSKPLTYKQFTGLFDRMETEGLKRLDEKSAAVRLSEFSRDYPDEYQQYRDKFLKRDSKMTVEELIEAFRDEQRRGLWD